MATVNVDLSCTATGNASVVRNPSTVKSATSTSVPKLVNLPSRSISATGTAIPKILRIPQKRIMVVATSTPIIAALAFGIDILDIFEGKRKWIVNGIDRFQFNTKKRFAFLVRGKPYG